VRENLGIVLQALGALAFIVGFGLWLGFAAACITLGVVLTVAGLVVELNLMEGDDGSRTDEAD